MEVPTIYKADFLGLCKGISGISLENMPRNMVLTYLHVLDPEDLPLNHQRMPGTQRVRLATRLVVFWMHHLHQKRAAKMNEIAFALYVPLFHLHLMMLCFICKFGIVSFCHFLVKSFLVSDLVHQSLEIGASGCSTKLFSASPEYTQGSWLGLGLDHEIWDCDTMCICMYR